MQTFLNHVAASLLQLRPTDMSDLVVVFPNQRASLFLSRELARLSSVPLKAPRYLTINELFQQFALADPAPLVEVHPVEAVCTLYEVYCQHLGPQVEPLDRFYGWGETMLADFNDIDKQLVPDVGKLFCYVKDWNSLRRTDFLSESQQRALEHFFGHFDHSQEAHQRFLDLWRAMPDIYATFNDRLRLQGKAYEGALWRHVVERNLFNEGLGTEYIFVGFNIFSPVQRALVLNIREQVGAERLHFYWDYDPDANRPGTIDAIYHDACQFIEKDIRRHGFHNALGTGGWSLPPLADSERTIRFVRTDTANAQAHYLPEWLKDKDWSRSAVVLADESLLPQLLLTLPQKELHGRPFVNVTMGYPLANTPIPGLIQALANLQMEGRRADGDGFHRYYRDKVEHHPLFPYLAYDPEEAACFRWDAPLPTRPNRLRRRRHAKARPSARHLLDYLRQAVAHMLGQMPLLLMSQKKEPALTLYEEALYQVYEALRTLQRQPLHNGALACRLAGQVMRSISIPLHGEPVRGLQVMGVLETRSLDFDNLLILSSQEGILPRAATSNSLIPYSLREPSGLSTEKEQVNVYAYNFFRLLRRARHVTMLFPSSAGAMASGEMSRFMRQLLAETSLPIQDFRLDFRQAGQQPSLLQYPLSVEKTPFAPTTLSPTAINCYLDCPMRFYYRYVRQFYVDQEVTTSLTPAQFGSLFHLSAENFYRRLALRTGTDRVTPEELRPVLAGRHDELDAAILDAFRELVFSQGDARTFEGELVVVRNVVKDYLLRLLALDCDLGPLRLLATESCHYLSATVQGTPMALGGSIDRIDYVEHHPATSAPALRVIDYKTGGDPTRKALPKNQDLGSLFDLEEKNRKKELLQTYLYSLALQREQEQSSASLPPLPADTTLLSGLIYIRHARQGQPYDEATRLGNEPLQHFDTIADEMESRLVQFLNDQLFNPALPYTRTPVDDHCQYCDYRLLCGLLR